MFELIATWQFWIIAAWFFLFCLCSSQENLYSVAVTIIGVFLLQWFTEIKTVDYIKGDYKSLIGYTLIYLAIGVAWSFFKWYKFLLFKKEQQKDYKEKSIPEASLYKSKIISWMVHWPVSAIGFLIGDLLADLYNKIYSIFGNLYDKMAQSVFKS